MDSGQFDCVSAARASELSADDREAITLCDSQGMEKAECTAKKGLTLSGAKSRVRRARARDK